MKIAFLINQTSVEIETAPMRRLIDVIREDLRLTGTKEGCGEGECGACTILFDGKAVCACLIPVVQASGHSLTTIEGLTTHSELHPLQQAFLEHGAAQCGICTPGFLMTAAELYASQTPLDRTQIREALAGNLCRCTGYQKIIDAAAAVLAPQNTYEKPTPT